MSTGTIPNQIGDRMKRSYEDRTRYLLPRRTYTILRIDGKAFHTFTRHRAKPFDDVLQSALDDAAIKLCLEAHGCRLAYGQSDEYSFLLTDFETDQTQAWFDGNVQKIVSVAASIFTSRFNEMDPGYAIGNPAAFDCRVFTIPDPIEVENYFIFRQQDCVRNSILSVGQANFSAKRLHGVNCSQIQELLFQEKGINWNDFPIDKKRGRCIVKENYTFQLDGCEPSDRTRWAVDSNIPVFTADRDYLIRRIPQIENRAVPVPEDSFDILSDPIPTPKL